MPRDALEVDEAEIAFVLSAKASERFLYLVIRRRISGSDVAPFCFTERLPSEWAQDSLGVGEYAMS
jgi:hypothetical protein